MEPRRSSLAFIFVTVLIDTMGIGLIIPIMPSLIGELIHGTTTEAARYGSYLLAVYAGMQFICSPIIGGLSDQYGRRPVLLASLFGLGVDYIFLSLAPTIGWLFVGRFVAGTLGASFSTAYAYIADVSTPEKRAQNFGLVGAAFGIGFVVGPMVGGLLGEIGLRLPFVAAACLSLMNFVFGYYVLPESLALEHRRKFDLSRANPFGTLKVLKQYPQIVGMVAAIFFIYMAHHSIQGTWSYYVEHKFDWSHKMIGYSLGEVGVLSLIIQGFLIRQILPKFGLVRSLFVGLVFYIIGNVLFAFADSSWMMFAIIVPYCFGYIAMPSMQGMISNSIPPNAQGEIQGVLNSLMSLASILGPLVMLQSFYYFSNDREIHYFPGAPMILGGLLGLLCLLTAAYDIIRRQRKKSELGS